MSESIHRIVAPPGPWTPYNERGLKLVTNFSMAWQSMSLPPTLQNSLRPLGNELKPHRP